MLWITQAYYCHFIRRSLASPLTQPSPKGRGFFQQPLPSPWPLRSRSRWSSAAWTAGSTGSARATARPHAAGTARSARATWPHARAVHPRTDADVAHHLQFLLLVRSEFVLNANRHAHVQHFDLALSVEHLAELRQGLLFIYLRRLHRFVQRFHRILQLPLQLIEARRRALNLAAHKLFLVVGQTKLALMLHDHLRRKHGVVQRLGRRRWPRLSHLILTRCALL